jgi:hypothetical protein
MSEEYAVNSAREKLDKYDLKYNNFISVTSNIFDVAQALTNAESNRPVEQALVEALKALVAVDDGIGPEDSFETAAQTVNDLDAAMNHARAALELAGEL